MYKEKPWHGEIPCQCPFKHTRGERDISPIASASNLLVEECPLLIFLTSLPLQPSESLKCCGKAAPSASGVIRWLLAFLPSMVERLVVVDVAPTFMPTTVDGEVLTYLRAMRETLKHISPEMSSPAARKEAERHLGSVVQEYGVLQFLLTNLRKGEHSYEWQFNAETLESCMRNITQMPELKGLTYDGRVLFICGRNSIFVSISNMHAAVESQQAMQQGRASRSNQGTVSESRHRVRGKRRPLGPSRQTRRISRAGHQLLER
ncbi:protein ABHD11 isoform X3 [Ixodes scapularis]|uniref:protein ABHD11 isoform X3 n=1 Tax=Ixodes scapularis TaxID=6945 RepID=UPI001C395BE6|nr:protein ABHD11 isoform X3 [Ixodes scapularis]